mmetsp:Transcript_18807/g.17951  ORF Transcript_18807/g.17951 Transcript_18807/m.17951 type:complete len:140 (+) Transcript_18807:379-798(+)
MGCVPGNDMTVECAYTKVSYLLGKNYSIEKIKKMMEVSLKGELTNVAKKDENHFTLANSELIKAIAHSLQTSNSEDYKKISLTLQPVMVNSVASVGDMELLGKLKGEGVDFNSRDYRGRTPLHVSTIHGHLEVVKYLVS